MLDCLDTAAATEWLAGCYGYVMASCVVSVVSMLCAVFSTRGLVTKKKFYYVSFMIYLMLVSDCCFMH